MSEWKTVRVRAGLLADVKARAETEGTNATAWVERTLGAALEGLSPPPGELKRSREGQPPSPPASRRASADPTDPAWQGEHVGHCTNARCTETGRVGDHCPRDPHLTFKA